MIEKFYEKYRSNSDVIEYLKDHYDYYYQVESKVHDPAAKEGCVLSHSGFYNRVLSEKQRAIKNRIRRFGSNRQNDFCARSYWELAELWEAKTLDLDLYSEDEWIILHEIIFITLPAAIKTYMNSNSVIEVCTKGSEDAKKALKKLIRGTHITKEPDILYVPFDETETAVRVPYRAVQWTNITLKRTVEESFGDVLIALIRKLNIDLTIQGIGVTISGRGAEDTVGMGVCIKGAIPGLCMGGEVNTKTSRVEQVDIKVLAGRSIESGNAKAEGTASVTFGWDKDDGKYITANLEGNLDMEISDDLKFSFNPTIGIKYKEGPVAPNGIRTGWHMDPTVKIKGKAQAFDSFELEGTYEIDPVNENGDISMRVLDVPRHIDVTEMRKKWRDIQVDERKYEKFKNARTYNKIRSIKRTRPAYKKEYKKEYGINPDTRYGGVKIFGGLIEIKIKPNVFANSIKTVNIVIKGYGFEFEIKNINNDYWRIGEFLLKVLNQDALDALISIVTHHRLWNEMVQSDKKSKESDTFWRNELKYQNYKGSQVKKAPQKISELPLIKKAGWFEKNKDKYCYCTYADPNKNSRESKFKWIPCNNVPSPQKGYEWRFGKGVYSGHMNWDSDLERFRIKYGEGFDIIELKIGSSEYSVSAPLL